WAGQTASGWARRLWSRGDRLDLDQEVVVEQPRDLDQRDGRRRRGRRPGQESIAGSPVRGDLAHVADEHRELRHLSRATADRGERGGEVAERLVRLRLQVVAADHAAVPVEGGLPGDVD